MTMPSFPNLPVLFPDEAVFLNQKGFRPPMRTPLPPPVVYYTDPTDPAEMTKKYWDAQSRKVVLDGLANNKSKELGMLGRKGLKAMPNSSLTGLSELSGGAVTKEGRQMAREFLKTRARNYAETRDASFFSPTAKTTGTTLAPPDTRQLYITLLSIADEIQVGNISELTLSKLNSAISSLLQIAPILSGKQMGDIRDFLTNMVRSCRVLLSRQQLDASKRRLTASALSQLERMSRIITQMSQTSSAQERELIARQMFTSLRGVEGLEPSQSDLFRERGQPPQLNPFEPTAPLPSPLPSFPRSPRMPRLPGEKILGLPVREYTQPNLFDLFRKSRSSGEQPLSPTSAAVEQALAELQSPPKPSGQGRYRRGRKY